MGIWVREAPELDLRVSKQWPEGKRKPLPTGVQLHKGETACTDSGLTIEFES